MEKLYIVTSRKNIIGMDDIQGPLTTPTIMKFNDVLEMVRKGYGIYQVNPYNHDEKVKVTISNINNIKFKTTRSSNTIQRKLNREIQEMNKPVFIDVVSKGKKVSEEKKQNKQNETEVKNTIEKLEKADEFSK